MADRPNQFQMAYVPLQDRMLLRIGTRDRAEFRLWLTRRVVRSLWDALLKLLEEGSAEDARADEERREAVLRFEQQAAVEQADFETPFNEEAGSFPLGEEGVLVTGMRGGRKQDGGFTLTFSPAEGKGVTLSLNKRMMHSFMQMLVESGKRAGWDLDLKSRATKSAPAATPVPGKVVRH